MSNKNALISECGNYRYYLTRPCETISPKKGAALFIMLNPSTADATIDDPTIRRCRGFAKKWDCSGLVVVNLYAYRATNPADLWKAKDPVGPDNDKHIKNFLVGYRDTVVCAWGNNAKLERVKEFYDSIKDSGITLWCLGTTKDGSPRHPLYIRKDQPLVEWKLSQERKV